MSAPAPLEAVAVITAAAGIKGDVWVKSLTIPADKIFALMPLYDDNHTHEWRLTLCYVKPGKKHTSLMRCHIDNITERNQAEALIGTTLYALEQPAADAAAAVVGMAVVMRGSNEVLGHITAVENYGASDILVIAADDSREVLAAWVDDYVAGIDAEQQRVLLTPEAAAFFA